MAQLSLEMPLAPVDPSAGFGVIFHGSPNAAPIRRALDAMSIAEEELGRAYPSRKAEPRGLFTALALPDGMRTMTLDLYRAHARELIARAVAGEDLAPGTRAEVLVGLYHASAAAPLREEARAIYVRLFRDLLPALWSRLPSEAQVLPAERWDGQVEDDIRAAQRAGRDESRRIESTKSARRARKAGA